MDEKSMELYGNLVSAVERWCLVFLKGGSSPVLTDGMELNFLRDDIKEAQDAMVAHGCQIPPQLEGLPPVMDIRYVRETDDAREEKQCELQRYKESIDLYGNLVSAVERWCLVFLKGGSSPILTDGQELNFERKKIKQAQDEMIKCGYWVPPQLAELPPEMDERYMKEADRIKEEAQNALQRYKENDDYRFIKEWGPQLGHIQLSFLRVEPREALEPVETLERAIEEMDYRKMQRCSNVDAVLERMRLCREQLEEEVEDFIPF